MHGASRVKNAVAEYIYPQRCPPVSRYNACKSVCIARTSLRPSAWRSGLIFNTVSGSSRPERDLSVHCGDGDIPEDSQDDSMVAKAWSGLCVLSDMLSINFAWVVLISCSIALIYPAPFTGLTNDMISLALAISMLAMGCTLKVEDFTILAQHPFRLLVGIVLQYTIMPFTGFCIARLIQLQPALAAGVILVSCCPGGVASNIVTYLAGGDVALSVAMTSISTLLAIGLTPLLTSCLIGTLVPVNGWAIFQSTLQACPSLHRFWREGDLGYSVATVLELQKIAPLIAVAAVTTINVNITARNAAVLLQSGISILISVATLHITGFSLGYLLAAAMKLPTRSCITISIEVGMQNSGLGAVLAMKHFGDPLTTCACVISACFHSTTGGLLASLTRRQLTVTPLNNDCH